MCSKHVQIQDCDHTASLYAVLILRFDHQLTSDTLPMTFESVSVNRPPLTLIDVSLMVLFAVTLGTTITLGMLLVVLVKKLINKDCRLLQAQIHELEADMSAWTHAEHLGCDLMAHHDQPEQDNSVCTVCFETLDGSENEEDFLALPCKHHFHHSCAAQWLNRSFTCPRCTVGFVWIPLLQSDADKLGPAHNPVIRNLVAS